MNRRNIWVLVLCSGLLLLVVGAVVVTRGVTQYRASVGGALRESCRRQVIAFEEFAEHWIIRDQLDSLEASAKLLLLGDGLYVDVVVQGQILFSDHDEGLDIELLSDVLALDTATLSTVVEELADGSVEARTPIVFSGYRDSPVGIIRIGFSGEYADSQIQEFALRRAGIGLGVWGIVMAVAVLVLWRVRRSRLSRATDDGTLRCGTLRIDTQSCEVRLNERVIELTPKLYDLLLLFASDPGVIRTDEDILGAIWPKSAYAASPDVKQCVYMLRRKLRAAHRNPKQIIVNVKGFGYRFDPPTNEGSLSID